MNAITPKQAVLEILVTGENYGLGIKDAVEERCGIKLGPGRLYPALRSLERDGHVTSRVGESTSKRGGRPRIYYKLTRTGRKEAVKNRQQVMDFYTLSPKEE